MKFSPSYNPADFETDIYAGWEAASKFLPAKADRGGRSGRESKRYSIVMPPPNANGNLHIGHGLTVATEDALTRYYRLRGRRTWYVPGADHAGFETWVVYERELEKHGKTRFMNYMRESGILCRKNVERWSFNCGLWVHHVLGRILPLR